MPGAIAFVPAARIPTSSSSNIAFTPAARVTPKPVTTTTPAATTTPASTAPRGKRPILLYNDQCEVCRALSAWVKKSDAGGGDLIDERPIGDDPEALAKLDPRLEIWDVYKSIHLLMPDGTIKTGGDAVGTVLTMLPRFHWLKPVLALPPAQWTLDGAYKLLDALRPAIGCKSCGGGPVAWWAKPVQWTAQAVRWLRGAEP